MTAQREEWRRLDSVSVAFEPGDIRTMLGLRRHASFYELDGAMFRDIKANVLKDTGAYDRRILLVTLQSALAQLDEAEVRERELRAWIDKRKARDKRSRDRYRVAHPDVHRKSARESMAKTRAARAALAKGKP